MAHNQDLDELETLQIVDKYVDYHAMYINPEGVAKVLGNQVPGEFSVENRDYAIRKEKLISGEKPIVKKNEEFLRRFQEIKNRMAIQHGETQKVDILDSSVNSGDSKV